MATRAFAAAGFWIPRNCLVLNHYFTIQIRNTTGRGKLSACCAWVTAKPEVIVDWRQQALA